MAIPGSAASNPIIITSYTELKTVKNDLSKHYRLGRDIDASASWSEKDAGVTTPCVAYNGSNGKAANGNPAATCTGFTPIGTYVRNNANVAFTGSFDGAGHKITSLYIKRETTDYVGLFGYTATSAEIKNIGVTDAYIAGKDNVGGLIGSYYSSSSVSNSYATGAVTGTSYVGGLIGSSSSSYHSSSSVSNSYATGAVTGTSYVGGLIGFSFSSSDYSSSSVSNSYATGAVTGSAFVGGLIGSSSFSSFF